MYVGRELAPFVLMPKEVGNEGEECAEGLQGDVPSRTGDLYKAFGVSLLTWTFFRGREQEHVRGKEANILPGPCP